MNKTTGYINLNICDDQGFNVPLLTINLETFGCFLFVLLSFHASQKLLLWVKHISVDVSKDASSDIGPSCLHQATVAECSCSKSGNRVTTIKLTNETANEFAVNKVKRADMLAQPICVSLLCKQFTGQLFRFTLWHKIPFH